MKFTVLTPLTRFSLIPKLKANLRQFDIEWRPILHAPVGDLDETWIRPFYVGDVPPGIDPPYWKLNRIIEDGLDEDRWYAVLCDDDLYEPLFFDDLTGLATDIAVVSMMRGHNVPPRETNRHPTSPLRAAASNMKRCRVGLQQLIVRGRMLRSLRYTGTSGIADGLMAEQLFAQYPEQITYYPDVYVLFNALEPGRYAFLPEGTL